LLQYDRSYGNNCTGDGATVTPVGTDDKHVAIIAQQPSYQCVA